MERQAFLAVLERALSAAPPLAGAHPPPPPPDVVPRVGWRPDPRPLAERFGEALRGVGARLITAAELPAALGELEVERAVLTTDRLSLPPAVERLGLERVREADAGVTEAVAACAATGTVVLAASPGEPRAVSLLPRVHVVAVERDGLVETPGDVLRDLGGRYAGGLPSALTFVTGPSRSADIGGELVMGVHGPLAVLVVLL